MSGLHWVRVGGSGPIPASDIRLRLAPDDHENALEALTLHDFDLAYSGEVSEVMAAWFANLQHAAGREQRLARAREISRGWSGPSRLERRIAAAYGVPWRVLSGWRPSVVLDGLCRPHPDGFVWPHLRTVSGMTSSPATGPFLLAMSVGQSGRRATFERVVGPALTVQVGPLDSVTDSRC